ncbi:tail fiber domain-containing protein [Burkholderia cenocepacia]|uniref:tail fiber domain-containing protein n=1 Tax=Burkholderia cenocepacia TaxID=95486 RepID=UPI00222FE1EE|nr:tail fiber domain-containing protein [Burkholderia cenocepacia]MCW3644427.1 tail fiber domain-containing protein [Burkholderia cenocepacia]
MSILQKANLGVAPGGAGGDDQRTANMRFNANVDALAARLPLEYTYLSDNSDLQPGHVGTRFCLVMDKAGKVVRFPNASSVPQNACFHLFNLGQAVTIAVQPGDGASVSILNNGDWAKYVSDGGTYWHVVERGRVSWNETVGGDLAVGGSLTVARDETVNGSLTVNGRLFVPEGSAKAPGIAFLNDGAPDTGFFHISDGVFGITCNTQEVVRYGPGAVSYNVRPTFGGKVPWDSGNLASPWHAGNFSPANYAALSGAKFTGSVYVNSAGPNVGGSRLVVGASGPEWPVEFNNAYTGSSSGGVMLMQACSTATQFAQFFYFSSIVGAITHNGSSVSYNTASDYRLKENIVPVTGATERLMKMRPARFNFINDPNKLKVDGFIAHELQAVVPYAVTGEKDAVEYRPSFVEDYDPEDVQPADVTGVSEVIVPQTVDHSKLVPLLAAALQEAIRRIEVLEVKKGT